MPSISKKVDTNFARPGFIKPVTRVPLEEIYSHWGGGSVSGLVRKVESMQPSILKIRSPPGLLVTYFYDYLNKELLYISDSRKQLNETLKMNYDIFSKYLYGKNNYYLGWFLISDKPLKRLP